MKRIFILIALFLSLIVVKAQHNQPVTITDMTLIKQIRSASFSHDGKKIVFATTSIIPDEANKGEYTYRSQIMLTSVDGNTPRPLTSATVNSNQPVWSKDDQEIAFVRTVKDKPQIFLLSLNGGEPIQLTNDPHGASNPIFSPDGSQILYSVSLSYPEMIKDSILNINNNVPLWTTEKPGFKANSPYYKQKENPNGSIEEIRSFLNKDESDKKAKVFNKLNFQGEASTEPDFNFSHYMIIDNKAGSIARPLTHGFQNFNSAVFTPDGKNIILSAEADSISNPDRSRESNIYMLSVNGGSVKSIISKPGYGLSNGKISPSGRYLVYLAAKEMEINVPQFIIYDFQNPSKEILIPVDRSVTGVAWTSDSKFLYFTAQSNGGIPIYKVNISTGSHERLGNFNEGISSLDVSKNQLVYVKTEVANPFELYVSDLNYKSEKRISSFNTEWLKEKNISYPEKKYYTNSKGIKIEYWVMKPINFDASKKYPVMLQIHGGPAAMWGPGESSMWHEYQYFCSKGYGVVYSNPRGSGGYGVDFLKTIYRDWGTGPSEDVLAALDGTLAEGWGNPSKTVVTGGSYAGYLTGWLVGHTKRFAAASSQRGVYDLTTFFGEGNAWRLVPEYFGGYPWEENIKPILDRESPFTYVSQITTPYLIMHGETDLRTGIVQGEMMYKALKVLNRPVEYVQHPASTHELTRSGNVRQRIDQMLRIYEFFSRFIM